MKRQFLEALPEGVREALGTSEAWHPRFDRALRRGAELMGASFDAQALARFLAGRVLASDAPDLAELRLEQLTLVFAALNGSGTAQAEIEQEVQLQLMREARRLRAQRHADETGQRVRELLFTAGPRRKPALGQYSGRGELGAFIRVMTVRELVRVSRSAARPREDALSEADLESMRVSGDDPELAFLRGHYRETFRAAFAAAMRELDEHDRRLLRQHFVSQVTLDELAEVHGVHRATVARWLVKARTEIGRLVRERLTHDAGISTSELDSLLRVAVSRLEISLRHLDTPRP